MLVRDLVFISGVHYMRLNPQLEMTLRVPSALGPKKETHVARSGFGAKGQWPRAEGFLPVTCSPLDIRASFGNAPQGN